MRRVYYLTNKLIPLGNLNTNGFQTLLNYPDDFKFDLVLLDIAGGSCFLPFLHKFNYPPLIAITAYGQPSFTNDLVGGHHYYAYNSHISLTFGDRMSFAQRFQNFLIHIEESM